LAQSSTAPRLKVLFLTEWYPTSEQPVGGIFVREHAKAVRLYDDVSVLHCAGADPKLPSLWRMEAEADELLSEGIPTCRVWRRRLPIRRISYLLYLWSVLQAVRRLRAQGYRPDIIHGHIYEAGAAAVMLGRLYGLPVVVTEHSTAFPRRLLKGLDVWKPWLTFRWADAVLPVSRDLQRSIESYGIEARFQVVPNVVDTQVFFPCKTARPMDSSKRLLLVGRLEPTHSKGVPYLLAALAQLRQQRADWHLDIVGDGPARDTYAQEAAELQLTGLVTFHGEKPKEVVADYMRQADIFVLPSLWENLPCVMLEAMASGLPIIASDVGGISEVVAPEAGILVPPKDVNRLATALADMIRFPSRFDRQVIARQARRFSPAVVGQELDLVYRRVLCARQAPGT
jgi:L-malate glycosyltransferase